MNKKDRTQIGELISKKAVEVERCQKAKTQLMDQISKLDQSILISKSYIAAYQDLLNETS
jgi:hypothetical protein